MHPLIALAVAAALFASLPAGAAELKWETEWQAAFKRAVKERRPVFVDYYAAWCVPCRHMDEQVFPRPAVAERLDRFVLLRIDGDKKQRFALMQGVRGYPTYVVYDPWKNPRFRLTGTRSPEAMAELLDLYSASMPRMMKAAQQLEKTVAPGPFIDIGREYVELGLLADARTEFDRARKVAVKQSDSEHEQLAAGQLLLVRAMEGEARAAIGDLEAIAAKPASKSNALFAWMAIARARWMLGEQAASKAALAKAEALAPDARSRKAIAAAAESWKSYPATTQKVP